MIITNIIKVESGIACAMVPSVDSEVFIDGSGCSTQVNTINILIMHLDITLKISPNNNKNSSNNNNNKIKNSSNNNNKIRLNRIDEQNIQ